MSVTRLGSPASGGRVSDGTIISAYSISAGSNRLLVVVLTREWTNTALDTAGVVTYGDKTLTAGVFARADTSPTDIRVEIHYLKEADIAAATGSDIDIDVVDVQEECTASATVYAGVDQTTPVGNTDTGFATSSTPNPIALSVSATAGAAVVSGAAVGANATATWQADLTEQTDQSQATTTAGTLADVPDVSGGSETCECTWSTQNRAAVAAMEVAAAPAVVSDLALLGVG